MSKEQNSNKRNAGIDLLRMIAMFMIVILHISSKGGVLGAVEPMSAQFFIAWFLESAAICAVNCYAIISGYVGVHTKSKFSSIAALWLQVAFYSVLITVIVYVVSPGTVTLTEIGAAFLPVITEQYWYFSAYFGMYILIPVLNIGIHHVPKAKMGLILVVMVVTYISASTIGDAFQLMEGYSVLWLICLYLLGAYCGQYNLLSNKKKSFWVMLYLIATCFTFGQSILFNFVIEQGGIITPSYVAPAVFLAACALVVVFVNVKLPEAIGKVVTKVSGLAFSVYLIHTHPLVFQLVLDGAFARFTGESPIVLLLVELGGALGIYAVCIAIDFVRAQFFKVLKVKQMLVKLEGIIQKKVEIFDKM